MSGQLASWLLRLHAVEQKVRAAVQACQLAGPPCELARLFCSPDPNSNPLPPPRPAACSPSFNITNPNSCYSLFLGFARSPVNFHAGGLAGRI